jgi:regulator of sirC expression with transglutaminase-like and TPR domain
LFGFKASTANLQDPQYFYLNALLDSKKGNPTSLGVLYLILAQQLELPIYGVNLPQHFILAHTKYHLEDLPKNKDERSNIIFYINPFNKGIIFTKNEIDLFLKKLNIEPKGKYYLPCSNLEVITIVLNGLIYIYQSLGSLDKVEELRQLLQVIED